MYRKSTTNDKIVYLVKKITYTSLEANAGICTCSAQYVHRVVSECLRVLGLRFFTCTVSEAVKRTSFQRSFALDKQHIWTTDSSCPHIQNLSGSGVCSVSHIHVLYRYYCINVLANIVNFVRQGEVTMVFFKLRHN
jgi:hypothetical protein